MNRTIETGQKQSKNRLMKIGLSKNKVSNKNKIKKQQKHNENGTREWIKTIEIKQKQKLIESKV